MAETVNLNKAWMENFINVDVQDFRRFLENILKDAADGKDTIPSLLHLQQDNGGKDLPSGTKLPLTIGSMEKEDIHTNGKNLQKSLEDAITSLVEIIKKQQLLFGDIEDNLRESLDTMFKTQGGSMDKVDGQKLIDGLEDVEDDLMSGPDSGGSDKGGKD